MREKGNQSPILAEKTAQWDGLRLEHHLIDRGRFPEHQHEEHAIIIGYSGDCRGELQTPDGFCARGYGAGKAIVLPAQRPHTISVESRSEYVTLFLDPAALTRAAAEAGMERHAELVESCREIDHVISHVARSLLAEFAQEGVCSRLYAESLTNLLTVHLLRHYTATARPGQTIFSGGLSGPRLRRVLDYVADNYERDLSLAHLAGEAGMSAFHFAREFKRATGDTPHQYLIKLRVERAKSLLAGSKLPLVEVSLRTGFSSQSHFTRLFRRLTGITPGTYRESFQGASAVAALR